MPVSALRCSTAARSTRATAAWSRSSNPSLLSIPRSTRGRDCLEELTTRDSGFALGFSYLAALDLREYQYGFAAHPGDAPPLDRGLIAARRGVELNPESERAYEMVFVILFARRELAASFDAANKAIALNRYDMRLLGAYGARLISSGDIDRGLAVLRQAGNDGTVRPPFEEFFLFLGDYMPATRPTPSSTPTRSPTMRSSSG
jgi:hypothetical protein